MTGGWATSTWTPPPGWWRTRNRILRRDGHRCTHTVDGQRCPRRATHVDHITPVHLDGTNDDHNLASLCAECHMAKSSQEGNQARARRRRREPPPHPGLLRRPRGGPPPPPRLPLSGRIAIATVYGIPGSRPGWVS